MIPFDLERAKKGVPCVTRLGHKAIYVAHLLGGQPAPLVFDIWHLDEDADESDGDKYIIDEVGNLENYYLDGRHGTVHDSPLDLFMEY